MKILCLISILILASCGMKETIISNMDTILYHKTQSKLDLDSKQKVILKQDIKNFLNEQRLKTVEASKIVQSIDLTQPQKIPLLYPGLIKTYQQVAIDYSLVLAKHMASFSDKQFQIFLKDTAKENKDIEAKINEKESEEYHKRFKFFFDKINESQKKVLKIHMDFFKEQSRLRLNNRQALYQQFKMIAEQKIPTQEREKMILDAFIKYNQNSFHHQDKMIVIIQELIKDLDFKQVKHFNEKKAEALEILTLFSKSEY